MSCLYSPKRKRGDWAVPALTLGVLFASGALAANLSILPNAAELNGPEARHQFLAEASVDSHQEDWTRAAQWTCLSLRSLSAWSRPTWGRNHLAGKPLKSR